MIPGIYLHLITTAFQKAENEDNEITNEGMYGKKLCAYLMQKLQALGYDVPSFWNEDWGWWIEIKGFEHTQGLCVYNGPSESDRITEYVVVSSEDRAHRWSWRHFRRFHDVKKQENILKLMEDLEKICNSDPQFTSVKRMNEMPW